MGLLTDFLVKKFSLPIPGQEICILWHENEWKVSQKIVGHSENSELRKRFDRIYQALNHCLEPARQEDQGPVFYRPSAYFTAALFEGNQIWEETLSIIQHLRKSRLLWRMWSNFIAKVWWPIAGLEAVTGSGLGHLGERQDAQCITEIMLRKIKVGALIPTIQFRDSLNDIQCDARTPICGQCLQVRRVYLYALQFST